MFIKKTINQSQLRPSKKHYKPKTIASATTANKLIIVFIIYYSPQTTKQTRRPHGPAIIHAIMGPRRVHTPYTDIKSLALAPWRVRLFDFYYYFS